MVTDFVNEKAIEILTNAGIENSMMVMGKNINMPIYFRTDLRKVNSKKEGVQLEKEGGPLLKNPPY
jgi:hypothetical protein